MTRVCAGAVCPAVPSLDEGGFVRVNLASSHLGHAVSTVGGASGAGGDRAPQFAVRVPR